MAQITTGEEPAAAPDEPRAAEPDVVRRRTSLWRQVTAVWQQVTTGRWAAMAWLGLATACWVAKGQISSIVVEVSPSGRYSVSGLLGPGQLGRLAMPPYRTFDAWSVAGEHYHHLPQWLAWYLVADVGFIASISLLGTVILRRYRVRPRQYAPFGAVIACYALEAVIGAITLAADPSGWPRTFLAWALHVATIAKWAAVIVMLAWLADRVHASYRSHRRYHATLAGARTDQPAEVVLPDAGRDTLTGIYLDIKRLIHALEVQRFSLMVVILLALIAIGPALADALEQMPDVQRAWLSGGSMRGPAQMLLAVAAQMLLALMIFRLSQMRQRRAEAKYTGAAGAEARSPDGRLGHRYLGWLIVPAAALALAGLLRVSGLATISWSRIIVFSATPLAIALASWLLERKQSAHWKTALGRNLPQPPEFIVQVTAWTGDALAVWVIALTPIGLVRAFTAPALVIGGIASRAALAAGVAGSVLLPALLPLLWRSLCRICRPIDGFLGNYRGRAAALGGPNRRVKRVLAGSTLGLWLIAVPFIATDVALIVAPIAVSGALGVVATAVIAIGSLAVLFGVLAYLAQTRLPLPIFRALRMNVTPVITIVGLIAIIGGIADSGSVLHRVTPAAAGGITTRESFGGALARWLGDSKARSRCSVPAGAMADGHQVRVDPLIEVAANGGGIRAAWWTVKALGDIARTWCGAHDVFAVSSVSGGSVGMAVLASVPARTRHPVAAADADMAAMAGPDALAAAVDGLMLRDTIAGYTGIDPAAVTPAGAQRFPDRAALIAAAWLQEDPALAHRFLASGQSWLNWALLFNATSASTGCRAIIATVSLPATAPVAPGRRLCGLGTAGLPGSYDFFSQLPCMKGMSAVTAALLSARYAYITPSATISQCGTGGKLADQLVDGGYGEGTGLSTLINLDPVLLARLRTFNDRSITGALPGQPITLVVPITIYLRNSVQQAPGPSSPSRRSEIRAVVAAKSAGPQAELTGTDALLQNVLAMTAPGQWADCEGADQLCAAALRSARGLVPDQVIYVAPREAPGVAAPLGWLLSRASRDALDQALRQDFGGAPCLAYRPSASYRDAHPFCLPQIGGLADLRELIRIG